MATAEEAFEIMNNVIFEDIEGEVVLINLDTGVYFSTNAIAAKIWNALEKKAPVRSLIERFCGTYQGDAAMIDREIRGFLAKLSELGLIQPAATPGELGPETSTGSKHEFTPPVVEIYQDMRELLLLDPVHDVDKESGWPRQKPVSP